MAARHRQSLTATYRHRKKVGAPFKVLRLAVMPGGGRWPVSSRQCRDGGERWAVAQPPCAAAVAVGGAAVSELRGCAERRLRGEATAPPPLPDRRGSKGCITYESWLAVLPG